MRHTNLPHSGGRRALTVLSFSLLVVALGSPAFGQAPQYPQQYPAQAPPAGVPQAATQPLMPPAQLAAASQIIDEAADEAGRSPRDVVRVYNIECGPGESGTGFLPGGALDLGRAAGGPRAVQRHQLLRLVPGGLDRPYPTIRRGGRAGRPGGRRQGAGWRCPVRRAGWPRGQANEQGTASAVPCSSIQRASPARRVGKFPVDAFTEMRACFPVAGRTAG